MARLISFVAALGLTALLACDLGTPVAAGGWAITTFDRLPSEFIAGQTYHLGYTIRQHGVTPLRVDRTEVIAVPKAGQELSFPGRPDGDLGHYVVDLAFPPGSYTWRVTQQPFMAQELGSLVDGASAVLPVTVPAVASPAAPAAPTPVRPLVAALAAATVASALVFARILAVQSSRRGAIGAS